MTWQAIAQKDVADSVRSQTFVLLVGGFVILTFGLSLVQYIFADPSFEDGVGAAFGTMSFLIPIVAILLSYSAIVGERQSGSLHVLLSLPVNRKELLLGKIVGRTLSLFVPILLGYLLAVPFLYLLYGGFALSEYAQFLTTNIGNGILYTVLGVSVSAALTTFRRVLTTLAGVFLTVYFGLYVLGDIMYWAIHGSVPETPPTWVEFITMLPPHEALANVVDTLWTRELSTDAPLVLQEWVSAVVLLMWLTVPVAVGYVCFRSSDII